MENIINLISKDHKKWVRIVKSFGESYPEDLVQDMYIKIYQWNGRYDKTLMYNETEVNYYFVFKVLRNLFLDKKKKKKLEFSLETNIIEPFVIDSNFEELEQLEKIRADIDNWEIYEKKVHQFIFLENKSMLELSKETGINYYSIYRSVKKIKKILKSKI